MIMENTIQLVGGPCDGELVPANNIMNDSWPLGCNCMKRDTEGILVFGIHIYKKSGCVWRYDKTEWQYKHDSNDGIIPILPKG